MKRIFTLIAFISIGGLFSKSMAQAPACINKENPKNKQFYSIMFSDSLADKRTSMSLDEFVEVTNEKGAEPEKDIVLIQLVVEGDPKADFKLFKKAVRKLKEKYPKVKAVVLMINEGYGDVAPNEKAAEGACERCKASNEFLLEFSEIMKDAQPGVKVLYKCN